MLNSISDRGNRRMATQFVQASFRGRYEAFLLFLGEEVTHDQCESVPRGGIEFPLSITQWRKVDVVDLIAFFRLRIRTWDVTSEVLDPAPVSASAVGLKLCRVRRGAVRQIKCANELSSLVFA